MNSTRNLRRFLRGAENLRQISVNKIVRVFIRVVIAYLFLHLVWCMIRYHGNRQTAADEEFEWLHRTRDARQYVLPDVETAILDANISCDDTPHVLILVTSAPNNAEQRQAVRDTWGYAVPTPDTKLLFFLGHDGNSWPQRTTESVLSEAQNHGDIVVENFIDSYSNLTLKSVFMLKWVVNHCRSAPFILKTDDDMLINIRAIMKELNNSKYSPSKPMIMGMIQRQAVPFRSRSSKWYLPYWLYEETRLPEFASGTGYIMTQEAVAEIYPKSLDIPLVPLEDVFVTGLVASRNLHIPLITIPSFQNNRPLILHPCLCHHLLTVHELTPAELRIMWTALRALNPATCDSYYMRLLAYIFGSGHYEVSIDRVW